MVNIDKLLRKRKPTGAELGVLEIANYAHLWRQYQDGVEDPVPLYNKEKFQAMLNRIAGTEDERIYASYIAVHEWLRMHGTTADFYSKTFDLQELLFQSNLSHAIDQEDVYSYISSLPVIMTEKQYQDTVKAGTAEATDYDLCLYELVSDAIDFYADQIKANPNTHNPLRLFKQKYQAEPVTDPSLQAAYIQGTKYGYYELPDGRRSDQMTEAEWNALVKPEGSEIWEAAWNRLYQKEARKRRLEDTSACYFYFPDEEIQKEAGLPVPEFKYYADPPADLTKWDVLLMGWQYTDPYDGLRDSSTVEQEYSRLMESFGDLIPVILADIDSKSFLGFSVAAVPVKEWAETKIPMSLLYEKDLYGEKDFIDRCDFVFDGNDRLMFQGAAIFKADDPLWKDTDFLSRHLDEKGYFIPPAIPGQGTSVLERLISGNETMSMTADTIATAYNAISGSYRFLLGYNTCVDMIIKLLDLPELDVFKVDMDEINSKLQHLNGRVDLLAAKIRHSSYEDKDLQEKKLAALRQHFPLFTLEETQIPEESKAAAWDLVKSFRGFRDTALLDLLCYEEV